MKTITIQLNSVNLDITGRYNNNCVASFCVLDLNAYQSYYIICMCELDVAAQY